MLVLHLLSKDVFGGVDVLLGLQVIIQQLLVVFLRVSIHVVFLPVEVRVVGGDVELVGEPEPESGAGEEADSKEDGLLLVHDGFVVLQVLVHGRDGFDLLHPLERSEVRLLVTSVHQVCQPTNLLLFNFKFTFKKQKLNFF